MFERFIQFFCVIGNNVFVLGVDFRNLAKTKKNHENFVIFGDFLPTFEIKIIKLTTSRFRHFLNRHL